jgi:hypothetical protein
VSGAEGAVAGAIALAGTAAPTLADGSFFGRTNCADSSQPGCEVVVESQENTPGSPGSPGFNGNAGTGGESAVADPTAKPTLGLPAGTVVELLVRLGIAMVAYTVLGVGTGALIRHQIAALCVMVGYLYAGELLLMMVPGVRALYPWLPGGATAALTDFTAVSDALTQRLPGDPIRLLSPLAGALVLFGYTALASTAALVKPMRRDVV